MTRVGFWAYVCLLLLFLTSTINANCGDQIASQGHETTFGFEVEYVPGENPGLWNYYRPDQVSPESWLAMELSQREDWVKAHAADLAPVKRQPAQLVRLAEAPVFLPERLIMDETGNWEIIGGITRSFAALKSETTTVEAAVAPGSYQAHVVQPASSLQRGAAGYTLFSADLLTFRKLTSQLKRYQKDQKQVPGAFFLHPFLSVYTELKKEMLLSVMEANLKGQTWESILPSFRARHPELSHVWQEDRPYYKYTLANTYRTDIYGNEPGKLVRWGFEVRGSHKSLDSLLTEVRVIESLMAKGFSSFERFEGLSVVDPRKFMKSFSHGVRNLLLQVIPQSEAEDPRPLYFTFLSRPFEQYADWLNLSAEAQRDLRANIMRARTHAYEELEATATAFRSKKIDAPTAKERCLVVLARFAEATGLLPLMESYLKAQTEGAEARRAA